METLNQREKEGCRSGSIRHHSGTHSFCRFGRFWRFQIRTNNLSGQVVNMAEAFTSQSDGLATTHQVPLSYLLRNGTAAFRRCHLGIPRNSYQVPWFGCLNKPVLDCFVKSFPNVGPFGNQRKGKDAQEGFDSPTNCQLKPSSTCIWKLIARPSALKDGTN